MERREHKRWPKRLSIRFWKQGEPKASPGYSTNVSRSGIFIRTSKPIRGGERVRLEIFDGQTGFMVEGEVARSIQVPAHLQAVRQPGMGVRFLPIEDLLGEVLPNGRGTTGNEPTEEAPTEPPKRPDPGRSSVPAYRVVFKTRNQYMGVFQRDLVNGGLFVATSKPAEMDQRIEIEISVKDAGIDPIRLPAKVVHRVEPGMEGLEDTNLMAGMGVEFSDPKDAVKRLTDLATTLF